MPERRACLALAAGLVLAGCAGRAAPPAPGPPSAAMVALGTEPFWSVDVLPGKLRYSTPDDIAGKTFAARTTTQGAVRIHSGQLGSLAFVLRIEPGRCSDGMSDTVYAWRARVTHGKLTLQGCAREGAR